MKLDHLTQRIDSLLVQARARSRPSHVDMDAYRAYKQQIQAQCEQLLPSFLAIDEETLPREQAPKGRDSKTYDRAWYRSDIQIIPRKIEEGRASRLDLEDLQMWVELYGGIEIT